MAVLQPSKDVDGKSSDDELWQGFVLLNEFEEVSAGAVLGYRPHVVLGLDVLVEFDDVGVG